MRVRAVPHESFQQPAFDALPPRHRVDRFSQTPRGVVRLGLDLARLVARARAEDQIGDGLPLPPARRRLQDRLADDRVRRRPRPEALQAKVVHETALPDAPRRVRGRRDERLPAAARDARAPQRDLERVAAQIAEPQRVAHVREPAAPHRRKLPRHARDRRGHRPGVLSVRGRELGRRGAAVLGPGVAHARRLAPQGPRERADHGHRVAVLFVEREATEPRPTRGPDVARVLPAAAVAGPLPRAAGLPDAHVHRGTGAVRVRRGPEAPRVLVLRRPRGLVGARRQRGGARVGAAQHALDRLDDVGAAARQRREARGRRRRLLLRRGLVGRVGRRRLGHDARDGAVGPDLAHDKVRVALAEHALDDLRLHGCHAHCFLGERHLVSFVVHCNAAECVPAAITAWGSALPAAALCGERLHSNAYQ